MRPEIQREQSQIEELGEDWKNKFDMLSLRFSSVEAAFTDEIARLRHEIAQTRDQSRIQMAHVTNVLVRFFPSLA
jgi:hypothetical protein